MVSISQSLACLLLQPCTMTMSDTNQRFRVPLKDKVTLRTSAGTFAGVLQASFHEELLAMGSHQIEPQLAEAGGVLSDQANWKLPGQHCCLPSFLFFSDEFIWEKSQRRRQKYLEWKGGKPDTIGIRRKKIMFSGWSRGCCLSGHQAHAIPFPKPGSTPRPPDASFTSPLPLPSLRYAEPDDWPHSCHSSSYGSFPPRRWKENKGGLRFNKEARRAFFSPRSRVYAQLL